MAIYRNNSDTRVIALAFARAPHRLPDLFADVGVEAKDLFMAAVIRLSV
jgi:hypothetical protein